MPANPLSALPNIFREHGFLLSPAYLSPHWYPRRSGGADEWGRLRRVAAPRKKRRTCQYRALRESVSVDCLTRARGRAFMPVAREPKKPSRGTLAREKTPPLQVCCSKTLARGTSNYAKMSFDDNKNSYGATDLEAGTTGSHIKDAAGVGTSRPAQNQFQGRLTPSTRECTHTGRAASPSSPRLACSASSAS